MTTRDPLRWHVVVPVKARSASKTRLAPDERRPRLALAFALDTIRAAVRCGLVDAVAVVTDDDEVAAAVSRLGARVVAEADDPDVRGFDRLNAALRLGVREREWDAAPVAALTADLPALRPSELERALRAAGGHERAFVPDHEGTGTSLLTALRGERLAPAFGVASAAAHAASGATRLEVADVPGLRLDVDWQHDLRAVRSLGCGPATLAVLEDAPIVTETKIR